MLQHAKGNLIDLAEADQFDVIVHGCNCFHAMGSGIAREIAKRYPNASFADQKTIYGDYDKLGNYTWSSSKNKNQFQIINAYTQYFTSKNGEDVFEYEAFGLVLKKIHHQYGHKRIGLPYIGMGLAGGDKDIILPMIRHFAELCHKDGGTVTLVEFSQ